MAYTQSDLTREVLGELFSLASGQTPNTDDVTWVEQRVASSLGELASRNIYYLIDAEEVPDEVFNPLVTYIAEVCAPKFGRPRNEATKMDAELKLRTLYRLARGGNGFPTMTIDVPVRSRGYV